MTGIRSQIVALGGELADLHSMLDLLAAGVEDTNVSRAITAANRLVSRLSHRLDGLEALMQPDLPS